MMIYFLNLPGALGPSVGSVAEPNTTTVDERPASPRGGLLIFVMFGFGYQFYVVWANWLAYGLGHAIMLVKLLWLKRQGSASE